MTLPFGDWPHLVGAPTEADVEAAREVYRREAARPTLAAMHVELRQVFDDEWRLELVGTRDGERVTYFSEDIDARAGGECEAAEARLTLAGYRHPWAWTTVDGGWDAKTV